MGKDCRRGSEKVEMGAAERLQLLTSNAFQCNCDRKKRRWRGRVIPAYDSMLAGGKVGYSSSKHYLLLTNWTCKNCRTNSKHQLYEQNG